MAVAATVLVLVALLLVVRPAVERGGAGELVAVVAIVALVLLAERWLRSR